MTPKQFERCGKGFAKRIELEAKERDASNWILGFYLGSAVNSPKDYPKRPYLDNMDIEGGEKPKRRMTDEEMEQQMRLNTIKMGGKIINGNNSRRTKSSNRRK